MSTASSRPVFVIAPGTGLQPGHYGLLMHLLTQAGYGVISALLPTCGTGKRVTIEDDVEFIRNRMILPILEQGKHNVVVIGHSCSGLPVSAAAEGLSRPDRATAGKTTSVIGQIYIAAVIENGREGKTMIDLCGGELPPHAGANESTNMLKCDDPKPPLFPDVENIIADSAIATIVHSNLTSYRSPIPRATFTEPGYAGRLAYIRTTADRALHVSIQDALVQGAGAKFLVRDIASGHNAQLSQPEKLSEIIVGLAEHFQNL